MVKRSVQTIATTNNIDNVKDAIRFCQDFARICYAQEDWDEIKTEAPKQGLQNHLIKSGHHSVFEHFKMSHYFNAWPKSVFMILNNEKFYSTSEKSARYTQMQDMNSEQKKIYDKWMEKLIPVIDSHYPQIKDEKKREIAVKKLAQENARYMISVHTPSKMARTVDLREFNYEFYEALRFIEENKESKDYFRLNLANHLEKLVNEEEIKKWVIPGLDNQLGRKFLLFKDKADKESFNATYSTTFMPSFASLAQLQRNRASEYNIIKSTDINAPNGVYIPEMLKGTKLEKEWTDDIHNIAEKDNPQGQLVVVNERGSLEGLWMKTNTRMCGHAQLESMKHTIDLVNKYPLFRETYGEESLLAKCKKNTFSCVSPCNFGPDNALTRII